MKRSTLLTICGAAVLLAACGGGAGDPAAAVIDSVPDEASASAAGMTDWLRQIAASTPDEKEPLAVARFTPPQSDDTEPEALK